MRRIRAQNLYREDHHDEEDPPQNRLPPARNRDRDSEPEQDARQPVQESAICRYESVVLCLSRDAGIKEYEPPDRVQRLLEDDSNTPLAGELNSVLLVEDIYRVDPPVEVLQIVEGVIELWREQNDGSYHHDTVANQQSPSVIVLQDKRDW